MTIFEQAQKKIELLTELMGAEKLYRRLSAAYRNAGMLTASVMLADEMIALQKENKAKKEALDLVGTEA